MKGSVDLAIPNLSDHFPLSPSAAPAMMMQPSSLVYRRARFATHNLWVTPYEDDQMFPAGKHVVQSQTCLGLAEWTKEVWRLPYCPHLQWS